MNLEKLFEIQAKLDKRIVDEHNLHGYSLLDKKILALQVELGELANEWRGFKFWSVDQEPRTKRTCGICDGHGVREALDTKWEVSQEPCEYCEGTGKKGNPLLEEYVDCLHFILSIGLELEVELKEVEPGHFPTIVESFSDLFGDIVRLNESKNDGIWIEVMEVYAGLFDLFIGLGRQLGFTTEQIEQAYLDKNKINHERQANGY